MPTATLAGPGADIADLNLPDTPDTKDASEVITVEEQVGGHYKSDHLPRELRARSMPEPPRHRNELTIEPETFVYQPKRRQNCGDIVLTVPSNQRVPDGRGGWTVVPSRLIGFPLPGLRYTTPKVEDVAYEEEQYLRGVGKIENEKQLKKVARENAESIIRDIKWAIWSSQEGRTGIIVPLDEAQRPDPAVLRQSLDTLKAAGVDVETLLAERAAAKAGAKVAQVEA